MRFFVLLFLSALISIPLTSKAQSISGEKCKLEDYEISSPKLFETGNYITFSRPAMGDIDGDNKKDLLFTGLGHDYYTKLVYLKNLGSGNFSSATLIADKVGAGSIELDDLNGDSMPDIVLATGSGIEILTNQGGSSYSERVKVKHNIIAEGVYSSDIIVTDVNLDNQKDISVLYGVSTLDSGSSNKAIVSVFINNGQGNFSTSENYLVHDGPRGTASGLFQIEALDLNQDGALELIVNNLFSNKLPILQNDGSAKFTVTFEKIGKSQDDRVGYIGVYDLNNDNRLDILAGSTRVGGSGGFYKLINSGNGNIVNAGYQPLLGAFRHIKDMDKDGTPEYFIEPGGALPPLTTEFSSSKKRWSDRIPSTFMNIDQVNQDAFTDIVAIRYDDASRKYSVAIYEAMPKCKAVETIEY